MKRVTQELRVDNDGFDQESTGCVLLSDCGRLERRRWYAKPCPFSPPPVERLCNPVKVNK